MRSVYRLRTVPGCCSGPLQNLPLREKSYSSQSTLPIVLNQRDRWTGKHDRRHDGRRQPKGSHSVLGRSRAFVPLHWAVEKVAVIETAMVGFIEPAGMNQLVSC